MKESIVFDVIVPVYKPDHKLDDLLSSLLRQLAAPRRIILMITADAEDDRTAYKLAAELEQRDARIRTHIVKKASYDHADTRNRGVALMEEGARYFLLMTQDAVPDGDHLSERLIGAFAEDEAICAVYARQLAGRDTAIPEKLARRFNYPAESKVKSIADLDELGIKTYFCSNVCAMYKKSVFDELNGFEAPAIFNEDMVFAATALKAGYKIAYEADARVFHAHAYTLRQQYKRSFDNGVSQAIHEDVFKGVPAEKEGTRYVRETIRTLARVRQTGRIPYFLLQCACRYAGFQKGKRYQKLSVDSCRSHSMNQGFWDRVESAEEENSAVKTEE